MASNPVSLKSLTDISQHIRNNHDIQHNMGCKLNSNDLWSKNIQIDIWLYTFSVNILSEYMLLKIRFYIVGWTLYCLTIVYQICLIRIYLEFSWLITVHVTMKSLDCVKLRRSKDCFHYNNFWVITQHFKDAGASKCCLSEWGRKPKWYKMFLHTPQHYNNQQSKRAYLILPLNLIKFC